MGELAASAVAGDVLVSLGLGSCIGLALLDRRLGVAGLAHVVLPASGGHAAREPWKFADIAVPELIDRVVDARRASAAAGGRARRRRQHVRRVGVQHSRSASATRPPCASSSRAAHPRDRRRDRRRPRPHDPRRRRLAHASPCARPAAPSTSCLARRAAAGGGGMSGRRPRCAGRDRGARRRGARRTAARGEARRRSGAAACARSTSRARRSSRPSRSAASGRTLEAFCRTASTRLSRRAARAAGARGAQPPRSSRGPTRTRQVPACSTSAIFEVEPIGTRMLLSTESTLLLGAIELLLGGSIDGGVKERRMTDIDQALGRHFFERLLAQLSLIWTDVAGLELDARDRRPAHGDRADGLGVRADAVVHDRGAPRRRSPPRWRC